MPNVPLPRNDDLYLHDPVFKSLVDYLMLLLVKGSVTPATLQEACRRAELHARFSSVAPFPPGGGEPRP
jgi:hypothetical protein